MKGLLFTVAALSALSLTAQDLQLFTHTPGSQSDGQAVNGNYAFADTAVGDQSQAVFRLRNSSTSQVYVVRAVFSMDPSFLVTGTSLDRCLSAGDFEDFTVTFSPQNTGSISTVLQLGAKAYPTSSGCPGDSPTSVDISTLASLQGNATASTLNVSYSDGSIVTQLRAGGTINFGQVTLNSSQSLNVTVQNNSGSPVSLPLPVLVSSVFTHNPFSLAGVSALPASLAPGASAAFSISFAPVQAAYASSILKIGSRQYSLVGTGVAGSGLQSLTISYTLPSGVHYNVTSATPIDFGTAAAGSNQTFIFTVTNPQLNALPVTIPSISLSGAGYSLTNVPALPVTLKPGDSTTFSVVFSPTQSGTSTAKLTVGSLNFTLTGKSLAQNLNPLFQFTPQIPASQQQAQVAISFPNAPQASSTGSLSLAFQSAVAGITDDPAILFVSSGGRNANVNLTAGSPNALFNGNQASLTFQTGTTAGTLNFTLSFADGTSYTKAVEIAPSTVQITSATATRQNPNLVIDLTAYDNSYSAGKLVFTFYDTKGNVLTPGQISLDETQDFHQYFFSTKAGGTFSLQATFPVTGDVTLIGAVDVTIQNALGASAVKHLVFN